MILPLVGEDSGTANPSVTMEWHHRGHNGSLLDIHCCSHQRSDTNIEVNQDESLLLEEELLNESLLVLVSKLRFVEYVALRVLSEELADPKSYSSGDKTDALANWIIERCFFLPQGRLETAIRAWELWQPTLDSIMPIHALDGELIPFPAFGDNTSNNADVTPCAIGDEEPSDPSSVTDGFRVNSIFTKPHVSQGVVYTFMKLVHKELVDDNHNNMLWLDAGAGSGSLLRELPTDASIGVDLDPKHASIHKKSFFDVTEKWLGELRGPYQELCIISNPPFSEGGRGDYTIIAKFLGHARDLKCRFMGVIAPAKFSRLWNSFGLPIQLRYRMIMPENSFYDPSTDSSKNIECHFLLFDLQPTTTANNDVSSTLTSNNKAADGANSEQQEITQQPEIHILAQRNKGMFPNLSTANLTAAVVNGLERAGVALGSSKTSCITMRAKMGQRLEVFIELNPKRSLSAVNSMSTRVENHSLGWMAKSVRPPVALALNSLSKKGPPEHLKKNNYDLEAPSVVVNVMTGEGTLEFESIISQEDKSSFRIVGDINPEAIHQVATQMKLQQKAPLMDFVVWDAQNLPLRDGIADSLLADLPFSGSSKNTHQQGSTDAVGTSPSEVENDHPNNSALSYPKVLAESVRVLCPSTGTAVLISPDSKSLVHATRTFAGNFKEWWQIKINIGGLMGIISVLVRKAPAAKDLNLIIVDNDDNHKMNHSCEILSRAKLACSKYYLDDLLCLQSIIDNKEATTTTTTTRQSGILISGVIRHSEYHHEDGRISHCYRLSFHANISNMQAKTLEKAVRMDLKDNPIRGTRL